MDARLLAQAKRANQWQSLLLVGALCGVLYAIAYSLFGFMGGMIAVGAALALFILTPAVSPALILRMYRARELQPAELPGAFEVMRELARRADLPAVPRLFYLPSQVMNAFTVGSPKHAIVVVSDGLLRRLNGPEFAAVLAHEITHIQNRDVRVMGFADVAGKIVGSLSRLGQILLLINLPLFLIGGMHLPWLTIGLLFLAPALTTIAQLALSRTREFAADAGAAELLGDSRPLASALHKIEVQSQSLLAKMFGGRRGLPEPSLLRTHPKTAERIERLLRMHPDGEQPTPGAGSSLDARSFEPHPLATRVHRPRWHRTGAWF